MKNTVQKYCLFFIYANIFAKKMPKYDNTDAQNVKKNISQTQIEHVLVQKFEIEHSGKMLQMEYR